ncbi:diguanylate cyclase (GGDEF) domain-containing protein/HDIG domain-containing protein [Bryocella elongata]|uniref:Diguanylate cyclase (GGDEF) domain-containing protein/HDIG domain-containing protein n=1 Tax=Bryocella elongata TaxID=863522 RepID=A0A1H6AUN0_9BACT|nr:HD domain-containing phosphohydrolase [Bryocella elongata]SEG52363.1 diguanylate cyclase (GGDEF) domain-containing protein/HDIG domain-containing protein [Bryocella elongata]
MPLRAKTLVLLTVAAGLSGLWWSLHFPLQDWGRFGVYLVAVLLSSGLKISMPRGDRKLAFNLPFILLAVVQLAPQQAIALAAVSSLVECLVGIRARFTFTQILFNVANVTAATAACCWAFALGRGHGLDMAPSLAAATVLYFLINTLTVAAVLAWSQGEGALGLWQREFAWYLPFYFVSGTLAVLVVLVGSRLGWLTTLLLLPAIYSVYRAYRTQKRLMADRQDMLEETEALHLRTIEGLAMAIEAKDHNTHEHLLRVRIYASEIGRLLGLEPDQQQALQTASYLHDIGKLAVPEQILNKPGHLTPEEFEKMKIHTVVGADIVERVRFPYPVVPIVRSHHESWDGSGYPDGLSGEEIPIGARVLSVVDCFDALTCDRPYRRGIPLDEAMAIVKARSGTQFDPHIVEVLEKNYVRLEQMAHEGSGDLRRLQTDVVVERGAAPAAGFERDGSTLLDANGADEAGAAPQPILDALGLIAAAGKESQGLFEITQMLGSSLSPSETILVMSSRLRRLLPFDCFALYLISGEGLTLQHVDGPASSCLSMRTIPMGEGLSGYVADCAQPIVNGNPHVEPNYVAAVAGSTGLQSALSIPLTSPTGEVFAVLTLYSTKADAFSREHLRILLALESKFALSLENALRFRQAEQYALVDPLTELPGLRQFRVALDAELNRSRRSGDPFSVAVCDLNQFHQVMEEQGRSAGDNLLRSLAVAFRESCRSYDVVARVGASKFLFLFPAAEGELNTTLAELIEAAVRRVVQGEASAVQLTASIGVACFPNDGSTAEDVLAAADRRMHVEKRRYYATHEAAAAAAISLVAVA